MRNEFMNIMAVFWAMRVLYVLYVSSLPDNQIHLYYQLQYLVYSYKPISNKRQSSNGLTIT